MSEMFQLVCCKTLDALLSTEIFNSLSASTPISVFSLNYRVFEGNSKSPGSA